MDKVQQSFEDSLERSASDLLVFINNVMTDDLKSAREEVVRTFMNFPFARPWAFEFTPAGSESATDAYLRTVGDADFVVWLVASTTTQPVVNEINLCRLTRPFARKYLFETAQNGRTSADDGHFSHNPNCDSSSLGRWCADAGRPTRFKPSSPSPTDAVRDGSAKLGHPVQNVTREHGLTPLPR